MTRETHITEKDKRFMDLSKEVLKAIPKANGKEWREFVRYQEVYYKTNNKNLWKK